MNQLARKLNKLNSNLYASLIQTINEVDGLLLKYDSNFPSYTDHSIKHTKAVYDIASDLLNEQEIDNLNADEIYILSMACFLHDIGMCIPEEKIKEISTARQAVEYRESNPKLSHEEYIRNIHHELSNQFILEEWVNLKIPSEKYAIAIGTVAEGHRKVDLGNIDKFNPKFFVKNGREFVCLPYLASILRIADELDITNSRTPKLLTKYYMPNNEVSIKEWEKHMATSQINFTEDKVLFEVNCTDHNIYASLQDQFDKIQNVLNYCQKTIRAIANTENRSFSLSLKDVKPNYAFIGFDPKGIKFSFDVQSVVTAFIGEDLYNNKLTSIREALQNSIDSCRYKLKVLKESYTPVIKIFIGTDSISIEDNGAGMDEFIIENFFGRLGSSFYEQEKIKNEFEAIGQFGVGVFSYFLISEYIDIETKTNKGNTLKFRLDKDPKSYFHFYDKTDRTEAGSTITMYLKEELKNTVDYSLIEKYVKHIFRHIEFDIEINDTSKNFILKSEPLEIDLEKEIHDRLKLQYKTLAKNYRIIKASLQTDDFSGECGLIINKDYKKVFTSLFQYLDYELFNAVGRHNNYSSIVILQKGVFINNYTAALLNNVIGIIDLNKKLKVNISRNQLSEISDCNRISRQFEIKILEKLAVELNKNLNLEDLVESTYDFLQYYYSVASNVIMKESVHLNVLEKFLYIKMFDGNNIQIKSLQELAKMDQKFVLISNHENYEEIWKNFKLTLIISRGLGYEGCYLGLKRLLSPYSNADSVQYFEDKAFEIIEFNKIDDKFNADLLKLRELEFLDSSIGNVSKVDSSYFIFNIFRNRLMGKDDSFYFYNEATRINYFHPFVQFVLKHYDIIFKNKEYRKIVKASIEFLHELSNPHEKLQKKSLTQLNDLIKPLNVLGKAHQFHSKDFYPSSNK